MAIGFDEAAFFRAVDYRRQAEGLSWRELARRLELTPSTFSRLSQGRRPDVETFLRLLSWLGMPAEAFMQGGPGRERGSRDSALSVISAALRRDPALSPQDVGPIEDIVKVAYHRFTTPR